MEGEAPGRAEALSALKRSLSRAKKPGADSGAGDVDAAAAARSQAAEVPEVLEKDVEVVVWRCGTCNHDCVPIRSESRCLCGHRFREHEGRGGRCCCRSAKCACPAFYFIVAEGSWVLRCSCKHKHTEHDPVSKQCAKANCRCQQFHSPWVCNCDHPWGEHRQLVVTKRVKTLAGLMASDQDTAGIVSDEPVAAPVNQWDQIRRGLGE